MRRAAQQSRFAETLTLTLTLNHNFGESGFGESGRHPTVAVSRRGDGAKMVRNSAWPHARGRRSFRQCHFLRSNYWTSDLIINPSTPTTAEQD